MESPNDNDQTQPVRPGNIEETQPPVDKPQKTIAPPADQVDSLFNTAPVRTQADPVEPAPGQASPRRPRRWLWIAAGILFVLLAAAASGYLGYQKAIQQRVQRQSGQVLLHTAEQYNLALADMTNKQWDRARTRLEYVISLNPSFPGAADKLKEVLFAQIIIATSTLAPTATETLVPGTPTPDFTGVQGEISQVQQYIDAKNWDKAISTIELLRQANKTYETVKIDGLLYTALRNRGVDEILVKGKLEQGTYDLALAEAIAPLDAQADSYRVWAATYLSGASYWGVDWSRVVAAFSQLYPSLPMLRDGNGWTAQERFRVASIKYGDQLAAAGDFCKAQDQYNAALAVKQDPTVQATATANQGKCDSSQNAPVTQTVVVDITLMPTITAAITVAPTNPPVQPTLAPPTATQAPTAIPPTTAPPTVAPPTATKEPPKPSNTPAPTATK